MTRAATQLDTTPATTEPAASTTAEVAPRVDPGALAELVAWIGADARRDPEAYLGRTVVPEGGE